MIDTSSWRMDEDFFKSSGKNRTPEQIKSEQIRKKLEEARDKIEQNRQRREVWDE